MGSPMGPYLNLSDLGGQSQGNSDLPILLKCHKGAELGHMLVTIKQ